MFAYIKGKVNFKNPTSVILDVNGIGYLINIPLSTYETLPKQNESVKLLIHFHVREDAQTLYGFSTQDEKDLFELLINISGIGPKMALTILSGASPKEFKKRIVKNDVKALTLIPGIGKKTAQRIIMELSGKLPLYEDESPEFISKSSSAVMDEAVKALSSLGYKRNEAEKAVQKACKEIGTDETIEKYIKIALNKM